MLRPEVALARRLRREMSYPEILLWQRLRARQTGSKFRKQHPIGPYVADFYCAAERLVVEVDGQGHDVPRRAEADIERDRFLVENGYRVVRILAADVLKNADQAAASIGALVPPPLHQPSAGAPPRAGEEQE